MARRTRSIIYLAAYLFVSATAVRYLLEFRDRDVSPMALLLGLFVAVMLSEPLATRRFHSLTFLYLTGQICIIGAISFIIPSTDYWAGLFFPLVAQVMYRFSRRTGLLLTGMFSLIVTARLLAGLGTETGLPLIFTNTIALFLFAALIVLVRESEAARSASQSQQAELRAAHRQLHSYTAQAQELAVLEERNRLARNLHDSVTQTIFSMRLTAEAAQLLLQSQPNRAAAELDKLQLLAKSALAEMRSLIVELRPTAVTELGLVPALRHHVVTLQRRFGLNVELQVSGKPHLSELEAQRLFRISQEALNNVVKHAHSDKARLTLQFDDGRVCLEVEDEGIGFEPDALYPVEGHIGFAGMQERVDALGGLLTIDSSQGKGTRVMVEIALTTAGEYRNGQDKGADS